jgi:DNA modification methylase
MIEQHILNVDCTTMTEYVSAFDVMITDPPYSARVHKQAVSMIKGQVEKRELGFTHLRPALRRWLARAARSVKRWSVMYTDPESANWLRLSCEAAGARYIRTIPWIRWSMPQLSGDRPPYSFETLLCFHAPIKGAMHWNGPGNLMSLNCDDTIVFEHLAMRRKDKHKTEKPLDQALDLVSFFSNPGETVFDPLCGSGTIGLACRLLHRNYIGCELQADWAEYASKRIREPLNERDRATLERWHANTKYDGPSEHSSGVGGFTEPSKARLAKRLEDRQRAMSNGI